MLSVRFWGVRGSMPCAGQDTVIYGGNTSCLEIRADERLVIVDLGTGIRTLGIWLMENDHAKYGNIKTDIFLTHTHWDHIIGFPIFSPLYAPGTELRIIGPQTPGHDNLKSVLETPFSSQYWPVRVDELAAKIEYLQIEETTLDLGRGLTVNSKFLNHPYSCLGYRFNYQGKSIATIYDHEPFHNTYKTSPSDALFDKDKHKEGELKASSENDKITQFVKDADILIHDSQYTSDEYKKFKNWGHSPMDHAFKTAADSNAKRLVLFHHEPTHTDTLLEQIEKSFVNSPVNFTMAKEGMTLQA
ncbi:MAG: MBL fold metallo-hydrolase [Treponema sp.]|nr:MBL fold metallo-hydrolase [Treponema sp.]